jgi:uncharacterized protein DUF1488
MPLQFTLAEPYYDPVAGAFCWHGRDGLSMILCKVTRSAIDDLYCAKELTESDRRVIFNRHRGILQATASKIFDNNRLTEQGDVVVKTGDLAKYHGTFGEYHRPPPGKFV